VRGPRLAVVLVPSVTALAFAATAPALGGLSQDELVDWWGGTGPAFVLWAIVGGTIAARRPANAIGWLFVAAGLIFSGGLLAEQVSRLAYADGEGYAGSVVAAWYGEWFWVLGFALILVFPLLLFPTGRLTSRRWRPALWLAIGTAVVFTMLAALDQTLEPPGTGRSIANPVGVAPLGDIEEGRTAAFFVVFFGASMLFAAVSLLVRFRRSRGAERQQLKWFTYAGALLAFGFVALIGADAAGFPRGVLDFAYAVLFWLPPIAAGIAMLRYRLYDIDLVVNRTLVYGSVTALLASAYLGCVLLLQYALHPVTKGNGLAVALSTLAVAALFRPARNRIQALVDRHFYRRKYDAQRTLEGFATRLREEVDLDSLRAELTGIVAETMQPAHVSVWLRSAEGGR
jgi:hypothetical protein